MSSAPKKKRMDPGKKRKIYAKQSTRRNFLECGQSGLVVTCNFREKECVREAYGVLNDYYEKFYGTDEPTDDEKSCDDEAEEEDISKQLEKQVEEAKFHKKEYKFQLCETGATNFMFIKADVPDVVDFVVKIVRDIVETGKAKARNVLRFVPIEVVTKANVTDIVNGAGVLFDKYFLNEPKRFSVICNRRMNNNVNRDEVIKELAALVSSKNIGNKVDLKNPERVVLVEIVKGHACISVLPDFYQLKKYNLSEICYPTEKVKVVKEEEDETKTPTTAEVTVGTPEEKPEDNNTSKVCSLV